jgi:hypothetical protein
LFSFRTKLILSAFRNVRAVHSSTPNRDLHCQD